MLSQVFGSVMYPLSTVLNDAPPISHMNLLELGTSEGHMLSHAETLYNRFVHDSDESLHAIQACSVNIGSCLSSRNW